jgi:hypothetical protein
MKERKELFTTRKIDLSEDMQYRIIQVKITDGIRPERPHFGLCKQMD